MGKTISKTSLAAPKLSNPVLYLMSISAGLVVANLYYNQPLLHRIATTFGVTDAAVSNVALSTQLGYALGLLFIIPLGDKVSNKKILRIDFLLMILALLATAWSNSLWLLIVSSFLVGFTSAIPQLFVPMAAQLSDEQGRGRAIGISDEWSVDWYLRQPGDQRSGGRAFWVAYDVLCS